jgi:hypothetical protein
MFDTDAGHESDSKKRGEEQEESETTSTVEAAGRDDHACARAILRCTSQPMTIAYINAQENQFESGNLK